MWHKRCSRWDRSWGVQEKPGDMCIYWVWPPPRIPVANEGLWESPSKHVIILVVPVTGGGPHPMYICLFTWHILGDRLIPEQPL